MPRRAKGPRLWLRQRSGREPVWVILDRGTEHGTHCGEGDTEGAERALARYIASKYEPPKRQSRLAAIVVADVMTIYLREHGPHVKNTEFLVHTANPIIDWWGAKTLADIRGQTCRDYVVWRCRKGVSDQTARHDLKTLRAAINYYHREYGPLDAVPALTMPDKAGARDRWLTRKEAARMLWKARRHKRLARFILIGLYTGTRKTAILRLRWMASLDRGYIDLEAGLLHRSGRAEKATKKRQPTCRIPARLLPHLTRWQASDATRGWSDVCHYDGQESGSIKTSWATAREAAGLGPDVTPHTLRHTCTTWLIQRGVPIAEVAGFVGLSIEMVDRVYGHHSPDHQSKAAGR